MAVEYDFGAGGYDISFTMPALAEGEWIRIKSDSCFLISQKAYASVYGTVQITKTAAGFDLSVKDTNLAVIETMPTTLMDGARKVRVTCHNEFISIYADGRWVNTFWLKYVKHQEEPTVWLTGSGTITLTDVLYPELNDWRDAIFIDLEQTGMNAISSIILSKPIKVWSRWNGDICFAMHPDNATANIGHVRKITEGEQPSSQACSDGIVYFTDVAVVVDPEYLEEYGFTTKLFRLPDLDQGIRAAIRLQDEAREMQKTYTIVARFDPRVEYTDKAVASVVAFVASGETLTANVRVDSLSIALKPDSNAMQISGMNLDA